MATGRENVMGGGGCGRENCLERGGRGKRREGDQRQKWGVGGGGWAGQTGIRTHNLSNPGGVCFLFSFFLPLGHSHPLVVVLVEKQTQ